MFISMPSIRLAIFADRKISEVQQDFTGAFPYLKIEFFKNGEVRKDRYPASQRIANSRLLREAWIRRKEESEIDINDLMSVSDLENAFMDRFGLSIQVFRRSGNLWLETTMTDNWTLKQQNDHGKEISTPFRGLSNEE
jgi:hypothetical protein